MVEMERDHGGLIRGMIARRRAGIAAPRLFSFDRGLATLSSTLADRLDGRIRLGAAVKSIDRDGRAWTLRGEDGAVWSADHVVLATAARVASTTLLRTDRELSAALDGVSYSGVTLVGLAYREQDVARRLDGYGYLVTRGESKATLGVVWESSLFPGRAPDAHVLLRVFLGGARRPDVVSLEPDAALELARHELQPLLGVVAPPSRSWVFRWPAAIAQYTVGHAERVQRIRRRLESHPGLHVCGTSYEGVSFNHAVASGQRVGQALAGELAGASREDRGADLRPTLEAVR
jgi:oxygen-dependent protoporphyrinogen oxidase